MNPASVAPSECVRFHEDNRGHYIITDEKLRVRVIKKIFQHYNLKKPDKYKGIVFIDPDSHYHHYGGRPKRYVYSCFAYVAIVNPNDGTNKPLLSLYKIKYNMGWYYKHKNGMRRILLHRFVHNIGGSFLTLKEISINHKTLMAKFALGASVGLRPAAEI